MSDTDHLKFRGQCKKLAEKLCDENPTLTLVRGWYDCPFWGEQQHFWCKDADGTVIDPSKDQFPSRGIGTYREYDGYLSCEFCGKQIQEKDVYFVEHHIYCSETCYGRDVYFG